MTSVAILLRRGDRLELVDGVVSITPASGNPVPSGWLQANADAITCEVASKLGLSPLVYSGFTVGNYGGDRYPGITLQFDTLGGVDDRYAIFNVQLTRQRNSSNGKVGSRYPGKQFAVGRRSLFYKFWSRTGLKHPKSLTCYHDYMGKLKGIYFVAECTKRNRLDAATLRPLNVSYAELLQAFLPDKSRIASGQHPDNSRITHPDKDFTLGQSQQGFQPNQTTGNYNYGTSNQGGEVQGKPTAASVTEYIQGQSADEWLADNASRD